MKVEEKGRKDEQLTIYVPKKQKRRSNPSLCRRGKKKGKKTRSSCLNTIPPRRGSDASRLTLIFRPKEGSEKGKETNSDDVVESCNCYAAKRGKGKALGLVSLIFCREGKEKKGRKGKADNRSGVPS